MSDRKAQDEQAPDGGEADGAKAKRPASEQSAERDEIAGSDRDALERDEDDEDDADEEGMDLDDLDAMGVDGVVAGLRGDDGDDEEIVPRRPPRPPWISAAVLAFSVYLLVTMFSDFRYWLRSSAAEDLGHAREWIQDARVPEGWHNHYVRIAGTPDVRNAALLKTDEADVSYLRVTEGDGSLFAAVPRPKDVDPGLTFPGQYEGRMIRLGSDRAFPWLQQFYADNNITRSVDIEPVQLRKAVSSREDGSLTVQSTEGPVTIGVDGQVRLVLDRPEARVQLGVESFPDADEAENLVASLGLPYLREKTREGLFHQFVVRIPTQRRDAVAQQLEAALEDEPDPADPKEGVSVLPLTATYLVPVSKLQTHDQGFAFPLPPNSPGPGYEVDGERLRERDLGDAPMTVALQDVTAARYEKPILVDPDGYLIVAGADPGSEQTIAIAWLVALGIALANAAALAMALRRRKR